MGWRRGGCSRWGPVRQVVSGTRRTGDFVDRAGCREPTLRWVAEACATRGLTSAWPGAGQARQILPTSVFEVPTRVRPSTHQRNVTVAAVLRAYSQPVSGLNSLGVCLLPSGRRPAVFLAQSSFPVRCRLALRIARNARSKLFCILRSPSWMRSRLSRWAASVAAAEERLRVVDLPGRLFLRIAPPFIVGGEPARGGWDARRAFYYSGALARSRLVQEMGLAFSAGAVVSENVQDLAQSRCGGTRRALLLHVFAMAFGAFELERDFSPPPLRLFHG